MKNRLCFILILALCVSLLSVGAWAADETEHTSHDSSWTELTADELDKLNYTLESGKYYLSSTDMNMLPGQFLMYPMTKVITVTGNVTLCLNNVSYTYTGNEQPAIVVNEGASLTICGCKKDGDNYLGSIFSNSILYTVSNSGTLHIASGVISSSVECGAAIYNAGTCTISGGKVSGSAGNSFDGFKTAYGVYNAENGSLTITGNPEISGRAPDDPKGPQIDVYTSDVIVVQDLASGFEGVNIGFYGEDGETVVSGVTDEDTAKLFKVTDPENSELIYNKTYDSLTFKKGEVIDYGSLYFAGERVVNNTKYKINYAQEGSTFSVSLEKVTADSDADDYDLLWNEQEMTLTLNSAEAKASCEYSSAGQDNWDALISLNCEEKTTLTINVIGKNNLTALNPFSGWSSVEDSRVIENRNGDINFTGDGSLTVEVVADKYTIPDPDFNVESMTAIYATGAVENQTNLTVNGSDTDGICQSMTGITCTDFTNTGTFTAEISDADTACAVDASGEFVNEAGASFTATLSEIKYGTGLACHTFENAGTMDIDIDGKDGAVGIADNDDAGYWINSGTVTIDVGVDGAPAGALGGGVLSGIDWRSDAGFTFTNSGTLDVTAAKTTASTQDKTQWPVWQLFDTIAVSLMTGGDSTVTNTGTMTLAARNGYTAGLYVAGESGHSITLNNSGAMDITVDTLGGENIRAVGSSAEIPAITTGEIASLPFDLTGGSVRIDAKAAEGASNVMADACMAVCLVQSFNVGNVPADTSGLQQINLNGMSITAGGSAIVTGPYTVMDINQGVKPTYTSYINTLGVGDIPSNSVVILPTVSGSVSIDGTLTEGSTLTANVSGLPTGVNAAYQWQRADSADGPYEDIDGATGNEYVLTGDDVGKYIRVVVTPTGDEYGGALTATTESAIQRRSVNIPDTYDIELIVGEGGEAKTNLSNASAGTTITVTATPDNGYELAYITVDGERIDGTTFKMPDHDVTVRVYFTNGAATLPFTDVHTGDWFFDYVAYVYANGLMDGVSASEFNPDGSMTRAMVWAILARIDGETVTGASWIETARAWAMAEGVSDGTDANGLVTREQLATMLWRYAGEPDSDYSLSAFTDAASVSEWAETAMSWAVENGLITGVTANTLVPSGSATRAQCAAILMRYVENI